MEDDGETPWTRQLLVGVGALLAVALVIGGVLSALALGAAKVSGIDEPRSSASTSPSLVVPSGTPAGSPTGTRATSAPSSAPAGEPSGAGDPASRSAITLRARPASVRADEPIALTGVYQGGAGATLRVQRLEGGRWADFPVTLSVGGRRFSGHVRTSRTGDLRFRVVDPAAGRVSNAVPVTVR